MLHLIVNNCAESDFRWLNGSLKILFQFWFHFPIFPNKMFKLKTRGHGFSWFNHPTTKILNWATNGLRFFTCSNKNTNRAKHLYALLLDQAHNIS